MEGIIQKRTEAHVTALFAANATPALVYHNLDHTKEVVIRAKEIMGQLKLSPAEEIIITVAAWFHDTGHLFTLAEEHEAKSEELAREFLTGEGIDEGTINAVGACINATRPHVVPETLAGQVLHDADTYHFGTEEFRKTNKKVKQEVALRGDTEPEGGWLRATISMLEQHEYYTEYAREKLEAGKKANLDRLYKKISQQMPAPEEQLFTIPSGDKKQKQEAKTKLIGRGVQTLFRLASENHFDLSQMADSKANILISVNAIIISITLTVFFRRIETDDKLLIPVIAFLISSLVTIIVAILSTRPTITEGTFTREDVLRKDTNLLFFGNFYKSSLKDYQWAMSHMMKDPEYLYSVFIRDVHQLGVVLGRKYKLIRLAYNVFMAGLILSVLTFVIFSLSGNPGQPIPPKAGNNAGSPF